LPETVESPGRFGLSVLVKGKPKGFCWAWMERVEPKRPRVVNNRVFAVMVPEMAMKEVLIASNPDVYFTEPHYRNFPAVLVRLDVISPEEMQDVLTQAWKCKASKQMIANFEETG